MQQKLEQAENNTKGIVIKTSQEILELRKTNMVLQDKICKLEEDQPLQQLQLHTQVALL